MFETAEIILSSYSATGREQSLKRMMQLMEQWREAARWLRDTSSRLFVRLDKTPIDTCQRMFEFVSTRAALIAQKKLYGYLKERMGTRYPKMFDDEQFVGSINIAKMHVFAACLSDMTVHAVAQLTTDPRLDRPACRRMALQCYREGMAMNAQEVPDAAAAEAWLSAFEGRLDGIHWGNIAAGASAFTESPKALVKWAPVADELKEHDREVVENSIRFAWNEIRQDLRERLDATAVSAEWIAQNRGA